MVDSEIVIRVEDLWKQYGLPLPVAYYRARRWLNGLRYGRAYTGKKKKKSFTPPWALQGVSFEVQRGEVFGVIGRNGAGKSTLLKVLAGVTPPTRGKIHVQGGIFPMIELNAGLHPELTGLENVRLLGAIMGLSRSEVEAKLPEIEDFCELGDWFERPVRMYSSGMLARLGFGVAMNVDAEVLLVDEVLAVGDLNFQRKCFDRIERLRNSDTTIIFVSHSLRQVERLCDRAILMEQGRIEHIGPAVEVTNLYYDRSHGALADGISLRMSQNTFRYEGTGEILVKKITILDEDGQPTEKVRMGRRMGLRVHYEAKNKVERPVIGFAVMTTDLLGITAFSNEGEAVRPDMEGSGTFDCWVEDLPFLPGVYTLKVKILAQNGATIFGADNAATYQVLPEDQSASNLAQAGFFRLHVTWDDRTGSEDLA